jgi:hypothetical protein
VARITAAASGTAVITQNVDGLHAGISADKLIEAHGRACLFKCITKGCRYSHEETITPQPGCEFTTAAPATTEQLPRCPECRAPALPQFLFFDELYESHRYYQWEKSLEWVAAADAFVFVGTSMAVGITEEALRTSRRRKTPVFSLNVDRVKKLVEHQASCRLTGDVGRIHHILGQATELLPALAKLVVATGLLSEEELPTSSPTKRRKRDAAVNDADGLGFSIPKDVRATSAVNDADGLDFSIPKDVRATSVVNDADGLGNDADGLGFSIPKDVRATSVVALISPAAAELPPPLPLPKLPPLPHTLLAIGTEHFRTAETFVRRLVRDNWTSALAVLEGRVPGQVFTDCETTPTVVVIAAAGGFWSVVGSPPDSAVIECTVETMRGDSTWYYAYSHPNTFWAPILRSRLGNVKEFGRTCFKPPNSPPAVLPLLPRGYHVVKVDTPALFDRYTKVWPWPRSVWGSFAAFVEGDGIGFCAIALSNRRVVGGCVSAYVDLSMQRRFFPWSTRPFCLLCHANTDDAVAMPTRMMRLPCQH